MLVAALNTGIKMVEVTTVEKFETGFRSNSFIHTAGF